MTRNEEKQPLSGLVQEVRWLLSRGELVPFLGAGASLREYAEETESYDSLPTGRELAHHLAEYLGPSSGEIDTQDLIEVASAFELIAGRRYLHEKLEEVFGGNQEPGSLHRFLAQDPGILLIVTTNYDKLIERAFHEAGREFHMIMSPAGRSDLPKSVLWWPPGATEPSMHSITDLPLTPQDLPVIYKIHGGFDPTGKWQGCVITEDDYFEIGGRIYESSLLPNALAGLFYKRSLLFLGYSLRDVHVRHLVTQFGRWAPRSFLVSKSISRLDSIRCNALGMKVYELTIAGFLEGLMSIDETS
jgi:hypothetical protein